MRPHFIRAALSLSFAASAVAAWSSPKTHTVSTTSSSKELEDAARPANNRRLLFRKVAQVSSATLLSGLPFVSAPGGAIAATPISATADLKVYKPQQHSLDGKAIVITGGNTGLGLESAKRLAAAGATVVLTSRSVEKGEVAVNSVVDYLASQGVTNTDIMSLPLDLCDFDSVRSFPALLAKKLDGKSIDVLMNNAGVMAVPDRRLTKDGYEKTFQTNHLGHFLLTSELSPQLAKGARVVNVSSEAWQIAGKGLELDNLNGEKSFGPWTSYGQSKLANILFTKELQRRADAADRPLTAVSLHPGAVQTDLSRFIVGEEKWDSIKEKGFSSFTDKVFFEGLAKFIKTVEEGASTQIFLSAGEGGTNAGGQYYVDCKSVNLKGKAPDDADKARDLWDLSERLTGTQFKL
mmetsp:Transcript_38067/g.113687  ORF Transcript_38067/g.113687 Transcript_38067/m.113687 type:complete len:407 (-) Transcript_38067:144-1364(-)|eukprot:CAMPEP_0113554310 /NCGR_PEP_ID=MMETSP0015_2-20120614/16079_1 /TAXON_ID=2838 /ORGANISM="Odontella" /LENGTH=406 /DNA_ID=CAMNT_0000455439 /DNA_START=106 /DNA_END=1326 /DNA_ORIENTATION=- /assembly_acc=CAM_ASM_000160